MPASVATKPKKTKKTASKKPSSKKPSTNKVEFSLTDAQRGVLMRLMDGDSQEKFHHATKKALSDRGLIRILKNGTVKVTAAGKKAVKK